MAQTGEPAGEPPLSGLKVVELARILAGPWIGQILADLGADVVKVEAPEGDDTRHWGPPFVERTAKDGTVDRTAAYFHAANRGKRSLRCRFDDPQDRARLDALLEDADVLVENFKVGGLAKYGLDYATLSRRFPRLVYCSVTGFGQDGPAAALPGYDFLVQGLSGIMDLTGDPEGEPQKVGVAWIDILTGLYGAIGIQAALAERERSGLGQHVDMALMDCGVAALANQAMNFLASGSAPRRMGNSHPNIVPYQVVPCLDGHAIVACGNDRQFAGFCAAIGRSDLAADPRFRTNPERVEHRDSLAPILVSRTALMARDDLIASMQRHGVPGGPINTVADALAHPQIVHRALRIDPEGVPGLRTPIRFSRSRLNLDRASPRLDRRL